MCDGLRRFDGIFLHGNDLIEQRYLGEIQNRNDRMLLFHFVSAGNIEFFSKIPLPSVTRMNGKDGLEP